MSREWKPGDVAVAEVGEYLTWDDPTDVLAAAVLGAVAA